MKEESSCTIHLLLEKQRGVLLSLLHHGVEGGGCHLVELPVHIDEMYEAREIIQIAASVKKNMFTSMCLRLNQFGLARQRCWGTWETFHARTVQHWLPEGKRSWEMKWLKFHFQRRVTTCSTRPILVQIWKQLWENLRGQSVVGPVWALWCYLEL